MSTSEQEVSSTAVAIRGPESERAISAFASQLNFEAAQRIARALGSSTLVPKEYQGNIPNCLIAMELASRTGASVFMVMQNLDVIHGRPAWRSQFLIAAANTSGRFTPLKFVFEGDPATDAWGCRAVARDKASGDECVGTLITIGLAKIEGWFAKNGSKWKTMPEQMLRYRAGAFWVRVYCPEIALGMQTAEEVQDATVVPATADLEELNAALRAAAAERGAGDAVIDPVVAEEPDTSPASKAQLDQLKSLVQKARDAEVIDSQDETLIDEAAKAKDGPAVRMWIRDIQLRIGRGQTSLGVEA